mmetsp:Transcript_71544/g.232535  ORF Transcript_71544/g.232535 Transcript_71544/m.232535 type:complete len:201 (-) Transcript_71544:664-1266(-)
MMHTKSLIKQVQASVEDSLSTQAQYRLRRQDSQHMLKHLHHQHVIRVRALQLCPSLGGVRFGNADHGDLNALIGTRQKQLTLEQAAALAGAHKTSKHQKQDGGGTSHHKYHDKAASHGQTHRQGNGEPHESKLQLRPSLVHHPCRSKMPPSSRSAGIASQRWCWSLWAPGRRSHVNAGCMLSTLRPEHSRHSSTRSTLGI